MSHNDHIPQDILLLLAVNARLKMQLQNARLMLAVLVQQAGGKATLSLKELVQCDPRTELRNDVDIHGNVTLTVQVPKEGEKARVH